MANGTASETGLYETAPTEDVKRLLELIDFEINRIDAEESRPGWTRWALFASVASAFWLLTIELENNAFSWKGALFVFLGLWIAYDTFKEIQLLVSGSGGSQRFDLINQRFTSILGIGFLRL